MLLCLLLSLQVGVCHNNVSIEAIFVASDGSWRLGELQHSCLFASASPEYLEMCRAFRDQASIAPEEKVYIPFSPHPSP